MILFLRLAMPQPTFFPKKKKCTESGTKSARKGMSHAKDAKDAKEERAFA